MIPRFLRGRPAHFIAVLVACAISLTQPACQDGEVDQSQVCAFQCDYTQDGTEPGYPAAAAGVEARLTVQDVVQVIANAIHEANANGIPDITVVVLDHLSNVLAVYDSDDSTTNYSLITSTESPNRTANTPFIDAVPPTNLDFSAVAAAQGITSLQTALDGVFIPSGYAAISKAGTSNYFSTQGNAFTSRTASVLIQQNFFPGETDRPGGPLFDVQIAQLACSDINTRQSVDQLTGTTGANVATDLIGPRRLPVGFAADPGGISLYKDNIAELNAAGNPTGRVGKVVVGAVGVEYNGIYGVDKDGTDEDRNLEERIAYGATIGRNSAQSFDADPERRANRITVAGRALRWVDDAGLRGNRSNAPVVTAADVVNVGAINAFLDGLIQTQFPGQNGRFVFDQFFFPFNQPRAGVFFLDPTSGVIAATLDQIDAGSVPAGTSNGFVGTANGEILVDRLGNPRYPAVDGANPAPGGPPTNPTADTGLTRADVQELLIQSLVLAEDTRAQTRRPLGGQARIDVAVVDLDGTVLGFARSQDALLDGVDVTIAKTRQAAFWSKATAQEELRGARDPLGAAGLLNVQPVADYVDLTAAFLEENPVGVGVFTAPPFNGDIAWSSAALGGIAGRDFPPGVASGPNGPLARDPDTRPPDAPTNGGEWSIFSTGIQTEIVLPGIAVAICEEVPDLAAALFDAGLPNGGVATRSDLFTSAAQRDTFCNAARNFAIASTDAGAQLDCMQGVQDVPQAPSAVPLTGLQNGYHQFQGAFPIYRNDTLIGAIGVSGDGAEQDDFVPFVALDEVGKAQAARGITNPIRNAKRTIRADNVSVQNVNLRYAVCPPAPFLSSNEQNGCEGR